MSLSERFKRLPEEQDLRFEESKAQARDASQLLNRLRATRQEAERLAIDEINRTKAMQREEVDQHPEIQDLKRRLRNAERDKDAWMQRMDQQRQSSQSELKRLSNQGEQLQNRLQSVLERESSINAQYEREKQDRLADEQRFNNLQNQIENLKREQDVQFINQYNSAQKDLIEAEHELQKLKSTQPEPEFLRAELSRLEAEMNAVKKAVDQARSDQFNWQERRHQAHADLHRAEALLQECQDRENQCKSHLDALHDSIGGVEAQRMVQDAQKVRSELQGMKASFQGDLRAKQDEITSEEVQLDGIRAEIRRLMEIEAQHVKVLQEAYSIMSELQGRCQRVEEDLKAAEERCRDAERLNQESINKRTQSGQEIKSLEEEYDRLRRAHHEAGLEVGAARTIIGEIEDRMSTLDSIVEAEERHLNTLNNKFAETSAKLAASSQWDSLKTSVEQKRSALFEIQRHWNDWKQSELEPLLQANNSLRSKLSKAPMLPPKAGESDVILRELDSIRVRINELQSPLSIPVNFEQPESLKQALQAKEKEISGRLMSRTSPASPRFTHQLEREAEAIMRAEAAAALEQKQAAIEKEATALSSIRLQKSPQVALDEEAKARLWTLNQEGQETGAIAQSVLDLVQSKNIKIRDWNRLKEVNKRVV